MPRGWHTFVATVHCKITINKLENGRQNRNSGDICNGETTSGNFQELPTIWRGSLTLIFFKFFTHECVQNCMYAWNVRNMPAVLLVPFIVNGTSNMDSMVLHARKCYKTQWNSWKLRKVLAYGMYRAEPMCKVQECAYAWHATYCKWGILGWGG